MKFEVSATLVYEALSASTLILNIEPFNSIGQVVLNETFLSAPELKMKSLRSEALTEKRFKLIEIASPGVINIKYTGVVENTVTAIPAAKLFDVAIAKMPVSVLPYLSPSRYCQSDKLYKFAYNKFGNINNAYERVIAIRDWIFNNVEYRAGFTNPQTTGNDTITQQVGVCRDFAHLGIALCRALTIPARYFTGYAYRLQPQDFHACFEVYLGGSWIIIDATKLMPVNGLVKIATGIDATDTALASIFGNLSFISLEVKSQLLEGQFEEVDYQSAAQGYSYS